MITTYTHKKTKEEIYIRDFTAQLMEANDKKSSDKIVIYSKKDNSTTFVMLKKQFDKEFTKK